MAVIRKIFANCDSDEDGFVQVDDIAKRVRLAKNAAQNFPSCQPHMCSRTGSAGTRVGDHGGVRLGW